MESNKKNIVIALMVAMFLGAVEGTVVTTAIPTIARDLSGFELISWVFSLYLLTSAVSTPIYGKLADLYGRKNVLSIGITIFLIGSFLCGLSQNMIQLIIFRALQGLGAGAIFTVTYTIVGDVFTLAERASVQGWLSTVWGVASLIGPFFGGFLIDNLSWHWIFFINIPFGILSIILLQRSLKENVKGTKHKFDLSGIAVLSAFIIILLYGSLSIEKGMKLFNFSTFLIIFSLIVLLIAFYKIEKNVKEPILPFEVFTRTSTIVNILSFLASAVLIGIDVYMPIYIQNVLRYGATVSGISMAPMSISWLLSSVMLSKAIPRFGERAIIAFSMILILLSCLLLPTLSISSPLILVILYAFLMGFGFGGSFTTLTIIIQASVTYNKRGAATAANSLIRTIGQTIGISIFGALFNLAIVRYLGRLGIQGVAPNDLYSTKQLTSSVTVEQIKASLNSGLHGIFIVLLVLSILCAALSYLLPNSLTYKE